MMLDKTINDLRIHVSTEGYPPYVRIGRPSHVGQPDIQMTFDEADEMIAAMQQMLAEARAK